MEVGGPAKFFKPRCSSFFVILLFFTPFTPKNPCRYGSAQNRAFRKDSDVSPEQSATDFVARFGLSYVIALLEENEARPGKFFKKSTFLSSRPLHTNFFLAKRN